MIFGAHFLLYSKDPEADRGFFRDVLGFGTVDSGEGWLIFAMPPSEAGIHITDRDFSQGHAGYPLLGAVLYLMYDDLGDTIRFLDEKGIRCSATIEAEWRIPRPLLSRAEEESVCINPSIRWQSAAVNLSRWPPN